MKIHCPLCQAEDPRLFHDRVWSCDVSKVYRCQRCDVTFIYPPMSEHEEQEFYQDYNRHFMDRNILKKGSPAEVHEWTRVGIQKRFERIRDYFTPPRRVLEIGSATGNFLQLLSGVECYGVEPSKENRDFSRRFARAVYADVSEIPKDLKFDVICMFHVFEHIRDPFRMLASCRGLLRQGGDMIIEVPHIDDPLISLYHSGRFKDFYFQPMHHYIYSLKSLGYVFRRAGFDQREVVYQQRYGVMNHIQWLSADEPRRLPMGTIEDPVNELLDAQYRATLEGKKMTDTIFYISCPVPQTVRGRPARKDGLYEVQP